MDRNRFLTIAIIVVAVVFIFNPFGRNRRGEKIFPPGVRSETLAPVSTFLQAEGRDPDDYVLSLFRQHDIVFVGEFHKIKQQVDFAAGLIPTLYQEGVRNLGIEHALYEDQQLLDRLLTASTFDERLARRIFFDFVVVWGFEEYVNLLRSAWQTNQQRAPGSEPFRVVGLNVRRDWRQIKSQEDLEDPEVIARVFARGLPEAFIADVITREFVERGEKALIYMNIQSSTTRYRNAEYTKNATDKGLSETRRAGNIIYDAIGDRAVFVALHSPWPDRKRMSQVYFPVDGVLDRALLDLPEEKRRIGFNLTGTPPGRLPVTNEIYSGGYEDLTLDGYADGYIILGAMAEYTPVTPIPDFVTEANVAEALINYPAPIREGEEPTVTELNSYIQKDVEMMQKSLDQFR